MRLSFAFVVVILSSQACFAWSEGGHHLIAVMTFELLSEAEQHEVRTIIAGHPRYSRDFIVPRNLTAPDDVIAWTVGRAAYWPDFAKNEPAFDRPTWHYQLGATLKMGTEIELPKKVGPLPKDATLATSELHLSQAIELCRKVLRDKVSPRADRALALSWLMHLVADAHQPCHAGSLYAVILFPKGDKAATLIPTQQAGNLHTVWDQALGPQFDAGDVRRRAAAIRADGPMWTNANDVARGLAGLDPATWLAESADHGRSAVYSPEITAAVFESMEKSQVMRTVNLSEAYLKNVGQVARKRAAFAAQRLALVLRQNL